MKNSSKLKSRRDFFKKAAKSALPIIGAIVLASSPLASQATETIMDCNGNCSGSCDGGCYGSCSGNCKNTCGHTCKGTCEGNCSKSCGDQCRY